MAWEPGVPSSQTRKSHLCKRSRTRFDRRVQRRRSRWHCWNASSWRPFWMMGVRGRGISSICESAEVPNYQESKSGRVHGRAPGQLGTVGLEVEFLRRVPMLKICPLLARAIPSRAPHHPSGTMPSKVGGGHSRRRTSLEGIRFGPRDDVAQAQRSGHIERADKFSRGQTVSHSSRHGLTMKREGEVAACNRVKQGQVSRAFSEWS